MDEQHADPKDFRFSGGGYRSTMISLATAAFGVVAALAWNKAITDLFKQIFGPSAGVWAELLYAAFVTILAVIVIQNLAKLADKESVIK